MDLGVHCHARMMRALPGPWKCGTKPATCQTPLGLASLGDKVQAQTQTQRGLATAPWRPVQVDQAGPLPQNWSKELQDGKQSTGPRGTGCPGLSGTMTRPEHLPF